MLEGTYLYQEIHEQPQTLRRLLEDEASAIQILASIIKAREIRHILIAARGTSDNAARYAKYLFGSINEMIISLAAPSLFTIYKRPPILKDALVLGISQSGKSPDVVSVVEEGRRQGTLTAAISNVVKSDLAQVADYSINLSAGPERSLAATKTYTAELTALAFLSASLADSEQMIKELELIPELVASTISANDHIPPIANDFISMDHCVVIGRGYNFATTFEFALKLKELTYAVAEPYSSADFFHGPLAMIEKDFPAFIIAPQGLMMTEMRRTIRALRERGAKILVVSDNQDIINLADYGLFIPQNIPEWLTPIASIIPCQLFAMYLANARGIDVDHPRSIRKVTKTW